MGCRHRGRRDARASPPRRAVSGARCVAPPGCSARVGTTPCGSSRSDGPFGSRAARSRSPACAESWRCCRRLASLLPVPIPAPQLVGAPNERYPWPFFGAPLLLGDEPAEAKLTDDDRVENRRRARIPSPRAAFAGNPGRGRPPARASGRLQSSRRHAVSGRAVPGASSTRLPTDLWRPPALVERILTEAEGLPPVVGGSECSPTATCTSAMFWSSGGPSRVSSTGATSASQIPRSTSCSYGCSCRPPPVSASLPTYGRVDDEQLLRARVLALFLGVTLAAYARDVDNARLERECVAALERTLID